MCSLQVPRRDFSRTRGERDEREKSEREAFLRKLEDARKHNRHVKKCFMTGKGCVQTAAMDRTENRCMGFEKPEDGGSTIYRGFVIMPFRPNLTAFLEWDLRRYIEFVYSELEGDKRSVTLHPANGPSNGYVACKRICQKIQESDFVIADISSPNPNVLYELGLAYGLRKELIVMYQRSSQFGSKMYAYLAEGGCKAYAYEDLNPIGIDDFRLSEHLWRYVDGDQHSDMSPVAAWHGNFTDQPPEILIPETEVAGPDRPSSWKEAPRNDDIVLTSTQLIKSAAGVAVANVTNMLKKRSTRGPIDIWHNYSSEIGNLPTTCDTRPDEFFGEAEVKFRSAYCALVKIGEKCQPISYFWVGFRHAIGRNVIPVLITDHAGQGTEDSAFDTQPLWHITFCRANPREFLPELQDALEDMIQRDFAKWSRNRFWDQVCGGKDKVAILVGADRDRLRNHAVVGAWDLLAVSALVEYLEGAGVHSEILQVAREAPKEDIVKKPYVNYTWIVVGSALVNRVTEFVLAELYGLSDNDKPLRRRGARDLAISAARSHPNAVIAFRETASPEEGPEPEESGRTSSADSREVEPSISLESNVFMYELSTGGLKDRRGFASQIIKDNVENVVEAQTEDSITDAHLLVAADFFLEGHQCVVLNGISGEATFALVRLLTQPAYERAVGRIYSEWKKAIDDGHRGAQFLYRVGGRIGEEVMAENVRLTPDQAENPYCGPVPNAPKVMPEVPDGKSILVTSAVVA